MTITKMLLTKTKNNHEQITITKSIRKITNLNIWWNTKIPKTTVFVCMQNVASKYQYMLLSLV